eukprot:2682287-Rhodomonas_salina.3
MQRGHVQGVLHEAVCGQAAGRYDAGRLCGHSKLARRRQGHDQQNDCQEGDSSGPVASTLAVERVCPEAKAASNALAS